jgi:outer membrane PBP1 activator LpoA protein
MAASCRIVLRFKRHFRTLVVCALAAMPVSGCLATFPATDGAPEPARTEDRASANEHRAAAEALERSARGAEASARDDLLAQAAEEWHAAGETRRAMRAIEARQALPGPDAGTVQQLLAARVELERGQPHRALDRVIRLARPLPGSLDGEALEIEGRARFALGDGGGAVAALVERARGLRDRVAIRANDELIWEGLQRPGLSLNPPAGADAITRGWLELAELVRAGVTDPRAPAMAGWRERYPRHPATDVALGSTVASPRDSFAGPRRVALLLPLSGRFAAAAEAVRDGFLMARFGTGGDAAATAPDVLVYDTERLGPEGAYEAAVTAGADFIVGPLAKPDVSRIAALGRRDVPVLALNTLVEPGRVPARFYQFALAPEEEAEQVAERALADGLRNALVLVSADDNGRRLLESFRGALERGGGRVVAYEAFDPGTSDHQVEIRRLLALEAGQARHRALAATLGEPLQYEARPRRDADFVFLGAQAADARLLRAELRFHFATELPVYGTSSVYEPNPAANEDLDGVVFTDMPWVVEGRNDDPLHVALRELGSDWQRRARLYAFGYDAYHLVPLLADARGRGGASLEGSTGYLTVADDGRVRRTLAVAEVHNGVPRPLSTPGALMPTATLPPRR